MMLHHSDGAGWCCTMMMMINDDDDDDDAWCDTWWCWPCTIMMMIIMMMFSLNQASSEFQHVMLMPISNLGRMSNEGANPLTKTYPIVHQNKWRQTLQFRFSEPGQTFHTCDSFDSRFKPLTLKIDNRTIKYDSFVHVEVNWCTVVVEFRLFSSGVLFVWSTFVSL